MKGLTSEILARACRIFLELAYPEGPRTIPLNRKRFWELTGDQPLEPLFAARDVCEILANSSGQFRGYSFRLGSVVFPHVKLQVFDQEHGRAILFAVDTHDALGCRVPPEEAEVWARLQAANRQLKERIEREWERQGMLTFNGLLRQALK